MGWKGEVEGRLGITLHGFQEEAIDLLVGGKDVVLSAPTGAGKTAVFQGAAVALEDEGVTVVVSPLVALLREQERRAREAGLQVVAIYGRVKGAARDEAIESIEVGDARLVLTTPETLTMSGRLTTAIVRAGGCAVLAVDEAHAYEQWADQFRSAYRRLGRAADTVETQRVLLCSATITVRGGLEAARSFNRWDWSVVTLPAVRPNLRYVAWNDDLVERRIALAIQDGDPAPPAIVYGTTAKAVEKVSRAVGRLTRGDQGSWDDDGRWTGTLPIYHGQMPANRRDVAQDDWSKGSSWIAATKAFGMGIDKPDVRTILHFQWPASVIDYAQETGRAGRDGNPSLCGLGIREGGRSAEWLLRCSYPEIERVRAVWEFLASRSSGEWIEIPQREIAMAFDLHASVVPSLLGWLVADGSVERKRSKPEYVFKLRDDWQEKLVGKSAKRRKDFVQGVVDSANRTPFGFVIHRSDLEEVSERHYKSWSQQLAKLRKAGVWSYNAPNRTSLLRVSGESFDFDPSELTRCRDIAFKRLEEMRDFARLPNEKRADAIRSAVQLEAEELQTAVSEARPKTKKTFPVERKAEPRLVTVGGERRCAEEDSVIWHRGIPWCGCCWRLEGA